MEKMKRGISPIIVIVAVIVLIAAIGGALWLFDNQKSDGALPPMLPSGGRELTEPRDATKSTPGASRILLPLSESCQDQMQFVRISLSYNNGASATFIEENGILRHVSQEEWIEKNYDWSCVYRYTFDESLPVRVAEALPTGIFEQGAPTETVDWVEIFAEEAGIRMVVPDDSTFTNIRVCSDTCLGEERFAIYPSYFDGRTGFYTQGFGLVEGIEREEGWGFIAQSEQEVHEHEVTFMAMIVEEEKRVTLEYTSTPPHKLPEDIDPQELASRERGLFWKIVSSVEFLDTRSTACTTSGSRYDSRWDALDQEFSREEFWIVGEGYLSPSGAIDVRGEIDARTVAFSESPTSEKQVRRAYLVVEPPVDEPIQDFYNYFHDRVIEEPDFYRYDFVEFDYLFFGLGEIRADGTFHSRAGLGQNVANLIQDAIQTNEKVSLRLRFSRDIRDSGVKSNYTHACAIEIP